MEKKIRFNIFRHISLKDIMKPLENKHEKVKRKKSASFTIWKTRFMHIYLKGNK